MIKFCFFDNYKLDISKRKQVCTVQCFFLLYKIIQFNSDDVLRDLKKLG